MKKDFLGLIDPALYSKACKALHEYAIELSRTANSLKSIAPDHWLVNDLLSQKDTIDKILSALLTAKINSEESVKDLVDYVSSTDDETSMEIFDLEDYSEPKKEDYN